LKYLKSFAVFTQDNQNSLTTLKPYLTSTCFCILGKYTISMHILTQVNQLKYSRQVAMYVQRNLFKVSLGKKKQQPAEVSPDAAGGQPAQVVPSTGGGQPAQTPKMALPPNEEQRQATVDALGIVHTSQDDPQYNGIAALVSLWVQSWCVCVGGGG